ncbi:PHB depolymerase family esterase [Roseomonas hellenica]|uniref:extracellular catalytic domain type 1 short-chain-length polyhydroxyalkanoate depolymerase n=1 Tax=Plastoroseomonas hellenica TaxID=2687306 RepID=UPI001BA43DAD|nr:PHB depolymerase family esterase [Plastoroseomonas hellenica]MBR0646157.1 PHB depolymerase family esterase [Plastoroseomonas hellenica]
MWVYAPPRPASTGAPLIVVLHGCRQDPVRFATDAGWLEFARRAGIPLVMPEQTAANNRHRCFNWYRVDDVRRSHGEAMSIRQMVRNAVELFGSDRKRIFIVGLSAGGAMAGAMLAAYPAVFAAGAMVAGMPVGIASDAAGAMLRMQRADPFRTRLSLVAAVLAATPARSGQAWPRLSIWQGGRDRTVNPQNSELAAAQWTGLHGLDLKPSVDRAGPGGTRYRSWGKPARPAVEVWNLANAGHGFPIDGKSSVGRPGPWVIEAGISAVDHVAAFWGIGPVKASPQ